MPKLKIAGLVIDIKNENPILNSQIADYLTDGEPDFTVAIDEDYIKAEIEEEVRCDLSFSPAYSEYLAIYRYLCTKFIEYGGFLMHGSAVAMDGRAYLFCAPSGTGKSTHTSLWRKVYGDRVIMVNDDKPLILKKEGVFYACGTPWSGKHDLDTNVQVPLKGVVILARGKENKIEKVEPASHLGVLFNQIYRPSDNLAYLTTIDLVDEMLANVPLYRLECNISEEAARIACETLSQN